MQPCHTSNWERVPGIFTSAGVRGFKRNKGKPIDIILPLDKQGKSMLGVSICAHEVQLRMLID